MIQIFGQARIGRDAVLRYTQEGKAVAGVALAFEYGQKGQDGKRPTQWVEASIWGQRAESLAPHLLKGTRLTVTVSDAHIETYTHNNEQRTKLVGVISAIEFAGSPQQGQQQAQQRPAAPSQQQQAAQRAPATNLADLDDDLPPF